MCNIGLSGPVGEWLMDSFKNRTDGPFRVESNRNGVYAIVNNMGTVVMGVGKKEIGEHICNEINAIKV